MKDNEIQLLAIGKKSRQALQKVLKNSKEIITPDEVHKVLNLSKKRSYELLSYWANRGWIQRIRQGIYVPIPLESTSTTRPIEDPWILADKLFSPCYIGGLSAAQYWDLTEQIFESVTVYTSKFSRFSRKKIGGVHFVIKRISEPSLFGTKKVWRNQTKISISDPSRTIVDLFNSPKLGGGIRFVMDTFIEYLNSSHKNLPLLFEYSSKLGTGTIFKRLGFLLEKFAPKEKKMINQCLKRISKGKSELDPSLPGDIFSQKWKLWYPHEFQ